MTLITDLSGQTLNCPCQISMLAGQQMHLRTGWFVSGPAGNNARIKCRFYESNSFVFLGNLQITCSKSYAQYFLASVAFKVVVRQLKNIKWQFNFSVALQISNNANNIVFIGHIWYLPPFGGIYVPCCARAVNDSMRAVNIIMPSKAILFPSYCIKCWRNSPVLSHTPTFG